MMLYLCVQSKTQNKPKQPQKTDSQLQETKRYLPEWGGVETWMKQAKEIKRYKLQVIR